MACGPQLIEAVAVQLNLHNGRILRDIQKTMWAGLKENRPSILQGDKPPTLRAIRYAIAELIRAGRARRDGIAGPVYAVRQE